MAQQVDDSARLRALTRGSRGGG